MNRSLLLIAVLLFIYQCLCTASSVRQALVRDEYDIQSFQAWKPVKLVVDSNNHIWFTNSMELDTLLHIDQNGVVVSRVRTEPPSLFNSIAFGGPHQLLHAVDIKGRRVVRLTQDGLQVDAVRIAIPYTVEFFQVDSYGTMYMTDRPMTRQIWRMDIDGNLLPSFRTDPVTTPSSLALDSNDMLYVSSAVGNFIYQIDRNGDQIGIMTTSGINLQGLFVDCMFNVHFLAFENGMQGLVKSSSDGQILAKAGGYWPLGVSKDGSLYVTDNSGDIMKLNSSLQPVTTYTNPVSSEWEPTSMLLSPEDNLIVINSYGFNMMTFTPDGALKSTRTMQPLQGMGLRQAVMSRDHHIYALYQFYNNATQNLFKLSLDGAVLSRIMDTVDGIGAFAVAPDGSLYVTNTTDKSITMYSATGVQLKKLLPSPDPVKLFTQPDVLHVDNSSLYVLDKKFQMVYQLSGDLVMMWSFNYSSHILMAFALTVDQHGDVYVAASQGGNFIRIRHSVDDSVVQYMFIEHDVNVFNMLVDKQSTAYLQDSTQRIIILTPTDPSTERSEWDVIVGAAAGACVSIVVSGVIAYRCIYSKHPALRPVVKTESSDRHASRRERTRRRCSAVNFLSHYHDNVRVQPSAEDSADYVLYV